MNPSRTSKTRGPDETAQTPQSSRDAQLLEQARAGDSVAFGELVELYQDRVYNAVYRIVRRHEDACDVTQETFVRAFRSLDAFRGQSGFYTWLFRIGVNLAISLTRRRKDLALLSDLGPDGHSMEPAAGSDPRLPDPETPLDAADRREQYEELWEAMQKLSVEHRTILVLRDIEMFNYDEIGEMLGLPPGTVRSRLHRARATLREILSPTLTEEPEA